MMRAQERSDPDPAAFARYGVGLPAASAPVKSASEVRAEQKQMQKPSAPKAEKPERAEPQKADAAKQQPAKEPHVDHSAEVLATFSERQRDMFAQIPLDKAISADWLVRCGYPAHEVMMALTMFEIKGLISSLPGGLYTRK